MADVFLYDTVRTPFGKYGGALAEWTAAAAGAELVVLPACGHLPPAENPVAVAALLSDAWEVASHG